MDIKNSKMHINKVGTKVWKNSKEELHRKDGPAIEWKDGDKVWYLNNNRHRLDGPAVDYSDGYKEWWILGIVKFTKEEFNSWVVRIQRCI